MFLSVLRFLPGSVEDTTKDSARVVTCNICIFYFLISLYYTINLHCVSVQVLLGRLWKYNSVSNLYEICIVCKKTGALLHLERTLTTLVQYQYLWYRESLFKLLLVLCKIWKILNVSNIFWKGSDMNNCFYFLVVLDVSK